MTVWTHNNEQSSRRIGEAIYWAARVETWQGFIDDATQMLWLAYQEDREAHAMMVWTSCPYFISQALYYAARYRI